MALVAPWGEAVRPCWLGADLSGWEACSAAVVAGPAARGEGQSANSNSNILTIITTLQRAHVTYT